MKTIRLFLGSLIFISLTVIACDDDGGDKTSVSPVMEGAPLTVFAASDADGRELWITDADGTRQLLDIYDGANSSFDTSFYLDYKDEFGYLNNKAFFRANNGTDGFELWITDGTAAGTHMLDDFFDGGNFNPQGFTLFNGMLYFAGTTADGTELWRTNGTASGTTRVVQGVFLSDSPCMIVYEKKLYFAGSTGAVGNELWTVDTSGNATVIDINTGSGDSDPEQMTEFDDRLYFTAVTAAAGRELWSTDGTQAGTTMVKNIDSAATDSIGSIYDDYTIGRLTPYQNRLYFVANDGSSGEELWSTDGTAEETRCAVDINESGSSNPKELILLNGKLYFTALNMGHRRLYVFDSVTGVSGEIPLDYTAYTAYEPLSLILFKNKLYFQATIASPTSLGSELWVSDGSAYNTQMIEINDTGGSNPLYFTVMKDVLYFSADGGSASHVLWTTDGTDSGTVQVSNLCIAPFGNE